GMTTPPSPLNCPRCGGALSENSIDGQCVRCLGALYFATDTVLPDTGDRSALPPFTIEELAVHFPQLEIVNFLGRGGMGVVYKARQISLGRTVALKLLAPERVSDPQFAVRFVHESKALAALNHPNIVTIHDFGKAGQFYYLLMEFVDGVNLRQAMTASRLTPEQALSIVPPVCEALQYAHEHGIVHRDIKPENLLLDKVGRVKIADFGIAKILDADLIGDNRWESQPAGTPQYMAPEQKAHRCTDHRADIYSLGVVLYEMLTGELPTDKLKAPSNTVQVDVRIDEIVLRALEAKPELRFATAAEFRTQVEAVTSKREKSEASRSMEDTSSRPTHEMPVWIRLMVVAVFLVLLVNFAGPHATRLGNNRESTFTIGLSQPWLVVYPQYVDQTRFVRALTWNFQSSSFASGVFAAIIGVVAISMISRSNARFTAANHRVGVPYGKLTPLLKAGTATLVTTAELASAKAQFFCYRTRGRLVLDETSLSHSYPSGTTVISLQAIRDLSIGSLPRAMNLMGLEVLSLSYEDAGELRQVLISPVQGWFRLTAEGVADWFAAIRSAVVAATGRAPAMTPQGTLGIPRSSKALFICLFAPPACLLLGLLVFLMQSWGGISSRDSVVTRSFPLRFRLGSEIAEILRREVVPQQQGHGVTYSNDNLNVTVTAFPDVLARTQTFITVTDWPDPLLDHDNGYLTDTVLRSARSVLRACAVEASAEEVSNLLSLHVLAELRGNERTTQYDDYMMGGIPDPAWENSLRGDWPGKKEAIERFIHGWNRYPVKQIRELSGVAMGFGVKHMLPS
ncbi:MAG: serine/threonine-protein kinase, partial [Aureliella sp.]